MKDQVFYIPEIQKEGIQIEGKNLKKLLIICNQDNMTELEETMLSKMMAAIDHRFHDDILLMKIKGNANISINQYNFEWQSMIVFGIEPQQLGFNIDPRKYFLYKLENNRKMLFVESLVEIQQDKNRKVALWEFLKKMFT